MTEDCQICSLLEEEKFKIYETDDLTAVLFPQPAAAGHIAIIPKDHQPIVEKIPDYIVSEMFELGNNLSKILFEAMGAQGTNLLLPNGLPAGQQYNHAMLHVIPRQENDNLQLAWQPQQVDEEGLSKLQLQLKEKTKNIGGFEEKSREPIEQEEAEEISEDEEDERIKQLRRLP